MLGKPSRKERKKLDANGRRAMATVLELTGAPIRRNHRGANRDPQASEWIHRVRIRVEPDGEAPFEVERTLRFPSSSPPAVNSRIAVTYDLDDHDTIERSDEVPENASREDRERAIFRTMKAEGATLDEAIARIAEDRKLGGG